MISIQVRDLTKRFGAVTALRNLDLSIGPGELFFLLGPSGCGKTTLLRTIAGFLPPDEGRIRFDAEDVTGLPAHERNTGMMFQSYALWPHMTVGENVAFGLKERRLPSAEISRRTAEALESVRMSGFAARKPNELSGGQQQRVALARALVIRPRCLLLDEPLSNLDARLRLEMRGEIRRVCKEFRLTTVYVTHDQKEALSIADRMAVLEGGRIAQVGTPREVYRRPLTRSVADFIGEADFLPGRLLGREGGRATVETEIGPFEGVFADPAARPAAGGAVTLCVRPECWRIGAERAAVNSVPGRIAGTVYLGEVAQYGFVSGGVTLKILEMNPGEGDRGGVGLFASVQPEDVVVLVA